LCRTRAGRPIPIAGLAIRRVGIRWPSPRWRRSCRNIFNHSSTPDASRTKRRAASSIAAFPRRPGFGVRIEESRMVGGRKGLDRKGVIHLKESGFIQENRIPQWKPVRITRYQKREQPVQNYSVFPGYPPFRATVRHKNGKLRSKRSSQSHITRSRIHRPHRDSRGANTRHSIERNKRDSRSVRGQKSTSGKQAPHKTQPGRKDRHRCKQVNAYSVHRLRQGFFGSISE